MRRTGVDLRTTRFMTLDWIEPWSLFNFTMTEFASPPNTPTQTLPPPVFWRFPLPGVALVGTPHGFLRRRARLRFRGIPLDRPKPDDFWVVGSSGVGDSGFNFFGSEFSPLSIWLPIRINCGS